MNGIFEKWKLRGNYKNKYTLYIYFYKLYSKCRMISNSRKHLLVLKKKIMWNKSKTKRMDTKMKEKKSLIWRKVSHKEKNTFSSVVSIFPQLSNLIYSSIFTLLKMIFDTKINRGLLLTHKWTIFNYKQQAQNNRHDDILQKSFNRN